MVAYLAEGWFDRTGTRRLRTEVVDGALDSAGYLHRAALDPAEVVAVAMRVRALTGLVDPIHRHVHLGEGRTVPPSRALSPAAAEVVYNQLAEATDRRVELQSFVLDCMDHVDDLDALRGLFLHLIHVAQVMRVLAVAQGSAAVHALVAAHDDLELTEAGRLKRQPGH